MTIKMHTLMITRHFGVAWHLPIVLLVVVIAFVFASAVAAVHAPAKRVRNMAITDTINEL